MSNFDEFCEKNGIQCGYARAGAKQAWNEQQKKIDAIVNLLKEVELSQLDNDYDKGFDTAVCDALKNIKEPNK